MLFVYLEFIFIGYLNSIKINMFCMLSFFFLIEYLGKNILFNDLICMDMIMISLFLKCY